MIFLDVKGVIDSEANKVMMQMWGCPEEVFSVETLNRVLEANPDEKEITLNLDCEGGSVEEGFKVYDTLRSSGKTIYTNITGGCHSMAVVLLLAAPEENRSANRNIRALIHRVYIPTCGYLSGDDCLDLAEACMMEEDAILDVYEERTGQNREELREIMRQEKIHDAKSLLKLNFISKINDYNTNQFFNTFSVMAKEKTEGLYERFMNRLKGSKAANKIQPKPTNYDYKDKEGNTVFSTQSEEDNLTVGDAVTLEDGGDAGTFTLYDNRVVTIVDNVVESIDDTDELTLEERVEELESLLEEATNVATDQQTEIVNLRTENARLSNQLQGSDYVPKTKEATLPVTPKVNKAGNVDRRTVNDIKEQSKAARDKFKQRDNIYKPKGKE